MAHELEHGDPEEKLAAARALWKGRSRTHAGDVLAFLNRAPPGGQEFRDLRREVEADLTPEAIRTELQRCDGSWGTWLAFLRPHADNVSLLLAGLRNKPVRRAETLLALGSSGDERALEPLLEMLADEDWVDAGFAAAALGYLGRIEAEPKLIVALAGDKSWVQAKACQALGMIGTRRALPALDVLAKSDQFTGAINLKGVAASAAERIRRRESASP